MEKDALGSILSIKPPSWDPAYPLQPSLGPSHRLYLLRSSRAFTQRQDRGKSQPFGFTVSVCRDLGTEIQEHLARLDLTTQYKRFKEDYPKTLGRQGRHLSDLCWSFSVGVCHFNLNLRLDLTAEASLY